MIAKATRDRIVHRILPSAILATLIGCGQPVTPRSPSDALPKIERTLVAAENKPRRCSADHLSNLIRLHPKVFSGGLPQGEAAFEELHQLGVNTIISVDGAKPDVETAARFGLKYLHLLHGYDGISRRRIRELAKAVRVLDGAIYIHCHHGKNRSPAAASVACISAGMLPKTDGLAVLAMAGTSQNYRGLYASVRTAGPLDAALLDQFEVEFPEADSRCEVPSLNYLPRGDLPQSDAMNCTRCYCRGSREHPEGCRSADRLTFYQALPSVAGTYRNGLFSLDSPVL